jgi:hypothetical protein
MRRDRPLLRYCLISALAILSISLDGYCSPNVSADKNSFAQDGTIADLDGDHQPDLALAEEVGRVRDGYLYRVRLKLSGGSESSFTFRHTDALGIRIIPMDVDGDRHVDLAIAGRFIGQSVGVWLNDGKGVFFHDTSAFPAESSRPAFNRIQDEDPDQAVQSKPLRQLPDGRIGGSIAIPAEHCGGWTVRLDTTGQRNRTGSRSHYLRAPPR